MKEADMWKYSTCLLFSCPKDNNKYQRSLFHTVIYPTSQVYRQGIRGQPPLTRWVFVTRKTYLPTMLPYYVTEISKAEGSDITRKEKVTITVKQIRRITREEGCVWADQRADRHQEQQ